jgi:hypothetical protein
MIPAKIATEMGSFEPAWRSVVWKDWMVEMVWFELAAPHAVLSNRVSATRLDRCDLAFAPRGVRIGTSA